MLDCFVRNGCNFLGIPRSHRFCQRNVGSKPQLRCRLFNSLDVNIVIRVTSLIVRYVFDYGYRSLLVAEDSLFLKNHTVSLL